MAIYNAAPKEHNRMGFLTEFQGRVKASLNVPTLSEFFSKLMRKTGVKLDAIYTKDGDPLAWIRDVDDKRYLDFLRKNMEYLLVEMKARREEYFEMMKERK